MAFFRLLLIGLIGSLGICGTAMLFLGTAAISQGADKEKVPLPLLKPNSTLVLFGDSITAPGMYAQMMQDALDQHFASLNVRVISRGQAGDTAERSMPRVASELVPLIPEQLREGSATPFWVLINYGINDVGRYEVADYLRHYEALIDEILKSPGATVGIVSPLYPDRPSENPKLAAMVAGLKEIATRRNLLYVRVYEALRELRAELPQNMYYALDGSHPNSMGHAVFAGTILNTLGFPETIRPRAVEVLERDTFKPDPKSDGVSASAPKLSTVQIQRPFPMDVQIRPWHAPSATANRTGKPVILDGSLDEWDLTAPPLVLNKPAQRILGVVRWAGASSGNNSLDYPKTELWAAYDSEALYFAVRVRDDIVRHTAGATGVQRDCVEIFLDQRPPRRSSDATDGNDRASDAYHSYLKNKIPRVAQFILPAPSKEVPLPVVAVGTGDAKMLEGTRMAGRLTPDGYEFEFAVPKSHFEGGEIRPSTRVGFDFSVNDLDISDRFSTAVQLRWSCSARTPFSTDSWGTLTMAEP